MVMKIAGRTEGLIHSPIGEAFSLLASHTPRRHLLDMSQAAPNVGPPPAISRRVAEVANDPQGARYVPQQGLGPLRAALAAELAATYPTSPLGRPTADDVLITAGCNQAFCVAASALTSPGDNVVLAVPYYFNHDMWLEVEGVQRRYLNGDAACVPSARECEMLIDARTRALVLVTPGNPSGLTLEPETIYEFAQLANERNLMLILDETYRNFRDSAEPAHGLYLKDDWRDHVMTLHSFSKDLAIPGYRVGALVGHGDLLNEAMKLVDCVAICAPRIGQEAALAGLVHSHRWRHQQQHRVATSVRRFREVMSSRPGGFEVVAAGGYFGWVRHRWPERPCIEVVGDLLTRTDMLVIPGTAFTPTDDSMLRFSVANLTLDEIDEVGNRLREL